jgi:hypothetical protein
MPYPVSQQFLAALASSEQKRISIAQVWNKGSVLAELGTFSGGTVNVDPTAQIRRTFSGTVESQGLAYDDLVPTKPNSLLNPASGNEIRIFRGFDYQAPILLRGGALNGQVKTIEVCPLGVFRITQPNVVDTGSEIQITLTGNDRSFLVSKRKWTDAYPITAGANLGLAVKALIQSRVPDLDLVYNFVPTGNLVVPATIFGTDLAGANDPYADATTLVTAAGMELFFDPSGELVMQPIPNPSDIPASFLSPALYAEGANATFNQVSLLLDDTTNYNGVVVIGIGSSSAPIKVELWNTDPTSPTFIGPNGENKEPFVYQTSLIPSTGQSQGSAVQQLLKMAQALYTQVVNLYNTPSFQAVPNPAMLESDIVNLYRPRVGLDGFYAVGQMTIPLDTGTAMSVATRPKVIIIPPGVPTGPPVPPSPTPPVPVPPAPAPGPTPPVIILPTPAPTGLITLGGYTGYDDEAGEAAFITAIGGNPAKSVLVDYSNSTQTTWPLQIGNYSGLVNYLTWPGTKCWSFAIAISGDPLDWASILSGSVDTYLNAQFTWAFANNVPIMKPAWEFNLPTASTPWGVGGADTTGNRAGFIAVWRYLWNLAEAIAPGFFIWWWNPTIGLATNTPLTGILTNYYPGDAYVDGVGADIYNSYPPSDVWPGDATWLTDMTTGNDPNWNELVAFCGAHNKDLIIPEWAPWPFSNTPGQPSSPGDDATFVNNMFTLFIAAARSGINVFALPYNGGVNWPVNYPLAYAALQANVAACVADSLIEV